MLSFPLPPLSGCWKSIEKFFFFFPDSPRMVENKRQFTVAANIHLAQREKFVYIMKSLNNENDFKVSLLAQVSW